MTSSVLPGVLALAVALALGRGAVPLHPSWSARLLATTAATTLLAVPGTLLFLAVNYGATLAPHLAAHVPEWALFGDDRPVPDWVGIPAAVLTAAGGAAAVRAFVRWSRELRAARAVFPGVLETDEPIAVAVPGRGGGVLVSRGLLTGLAPRELEAVFQHERSHLRHAHHRYLAVGELAAAVLPPLRPLAVRLRFAVERWADEEAAEAVGDRRLVARTIAKVALGRAGEADAGPLPAFTDSEVVRRVRALLGAPPAKNTVTGPVALALSGSATGALAALACQLDHALASTFL
ncbi:M56 family metallopeptidase [Actinomadura kijaniata]|uniref:M56 family metallopeptidase n=1 Tax=Actinomadura kijaniata TaxID=46161 RepID=UPI000831582A|nr:M56 family metallopeptidase [Actinomadura kijaniata]